MADFRFEEDKIFADNSGAFLEVIKADDPATAAILQGNWDALVAQEKGN